MIFTRKLGRGVRAATPAWLLIMWLVFAFIPLDPFDEIIPAVVTLVILAMQPQRLPRFASAWRGGKSHRRYDHECT